MGGMRSAGESVRRRRAGSRLLSLLGFPAGALVLIIVLLIWIALPVLLANAVWFGAADLGPSIRAAEGHGRPGVFTITDQSCGRQGCTWSGDFASDDGTVVRCGVNYDGQVADGVGIADEVRAIDNGGFDVYQPSGSWHWLMDVGFIVGGLAFGGLWCRRYVVRPILRVRRRRATGRRDPASAPG
jgi:hypothetical protein